MRRLVPAFTCLVSLAIVGIWLSCGRDNTVVPSDRSMPVEGDEAAALFEWAIGPIEGITTAWHPAPFEIAVPIGTTLRLKCGGSRSAEIQWTNAEEVSRGDRESIAECHIDTPGRHEISVAVASNAADGGNKRDPAQRATSVHTCVVNGIDAGVDQIGVVALEPRVAPFLITESSSNYETMKAVLGGDEYGQGVSQLRRIGPNHYRTAVNRNVALGATLADPRFASVIETRITGERPTLGAEIVQLQKPGRYAVSVGPPARAKSIVLESYKVAITGVANSGGGSSVRDGEPATFVAQTDPPGYEDEITWVASTKYGEARPVVGHGPQFTVEFQSTERGDSWLGVRADNAIFTQDGPLGCAEYSETDGPLVGGCGSPARRDDPTGAPREPILAPPCKRPPFDDSPIQVHVSTAVPVAMRPYIQAAFDQWENQTDVDFEVVFSDVDPGDGVIMVKWNDTESPDSTVAQNNSLVWDCTLSSRTKKATIDLWSRDACSAPYTETAIRNATLHEIGHALGLGHDGTLGSPADENSVMQDYANNFRNDGTLIDYTTTNKQLSQSDKDAIDSKY